MANRPAVFLRSPGVAVVVVGLASERKLSAHVVVMHPDRQGRRLAIGESQATKIFICNLMTQPGETDNYSARQHLETTKSYAPEIHFDFVIVNDRRVTKEQAQRYAQEGAYQIGIDDDAIDSVLDESTQVIRTNLLEEGEKVRHDSTLLARVVLACKQQHRLRPTVSV